MINLSLSQRIAEETAKICGHSISIMDSTGLIIGSDDLSRINTFYGGLDPVFEKRTYTAHNEEEVKNVQGAYAGMAFPIILNEKVIGALGIRGNPEEVKKYAQLVKSQVEMMYQQEMYFEISRMKSDAFDIFIQELLSEKIYHNEEHIKTLGQINGFNLDIPRFAAIIEISEIDEMINGLSVENSEESYFKRMKAY